MGISNIRKKIPGLLEKRNLLINNEETEEYQIQKEGDMEWKKCKYLGTLLDTENDTRRRTQINKKIYSLIT